MSAHLLLVDNRQQNLDLTRIILEARGYQVSTSDNARDALDFLRARHVDIIVSDINMPDKDGFEFVKLVKKDDGLRNIRFVFLTASFWTETVKNEGLALGADHFIFRPADPKDLLAEIEAAIPAELRAHKELPDLH